MLVFIAWDGDKIGRQVERAALANDATKLRQVSQAIEHGNSVWRSWVESHGGSIISYGGDEGRAQVDARHLEQLPEIRRQYQTAVGSTATVGVGQKLSQADRALVAGKLKGGDQVVLYTPEVEDEIRAALKERTEADKVTDAAGLGKAEGAASPVSPEISSPALNAGQGNAGMTGGHQPAAPKGPQKPVVEGSEHSQGEAAANFAAENHVSPETTHAASLEDEFHKVASEGEDDDEEQPQGEDTHVLKQRVVQVLQEIKGQAKVIAQLKEAAPKAYEAVMDLVSEMIQVARSIPGGGAAAPGDKSEVKKAEAELDEAREAVPFQFRRTPKIPYGMASAGETIEVPIDRLNASQRFVYKRGVEKYANGQHGPVVVYAEPDGTFTVGDGHHRAMAANRRGAKTILARVVPIVKDLSFYKAEPAFAEAGFLHKPSGTVYGTGAYHDITKLPTDYSPDYEDGFITPAGDFMTREQASAALGRDEGANLQSEDLRDMGLGRELDKNEEQSTVVYRVENANGDGPYKTGDLKQEQSENQPPAHTDFEPEVFQAMDERGYRFGFENPQQATNWFGASAFRALKTKGFKLVQVPAKQVFQSKSGTQVIYEPAEDLGKTSLPMPHANPHHHVKWPVGAVDTRTQRVKVQHKDGAAPAQAGWVEVQAGQVLSQDGHTISSRNPGGR